MVMLEGGQVSGTVSTDPLLLDELHKIFQGICPEFNDSPIMAALKLF